jgi:hypothetical protein
MKLKLKGKRHHVIGRYLKTGVLEEPLITARETRELAPAAQH